MNLFTQHPSSVGESYYQHMKLASQFSFKLMLAGLACFIHALLPFLFEKTGSKAILELNHLMLEKRGSK